MHPKIAVFVFVKPWRSLEAALPSYHRLGDAAGTDDNLFSLTFPSEVERT